MPEKKKQPQIQQTAIGDGNVQVAGDNNTVSQTIIQKFFNIFKSDAETVDQRNRRIMLGHVENFWVKGILEKSLHGAALLKLGIKEDPDALTYPWAIKREATKEILPAGTSMLQIFQEIGLGRSLLILGAPGSGKTTMLLELTRQLIERAREDVTEPIPVVFNLSSWTEKFTLADWLARELNTIYNVPKKIAPSWVKENKMLLLLDGLDEVKQESRDKCVEATNQFRKENGLTSMVVCSRIQDYADLKVRLSFDGAVEIQPLAANQIDAYFKCFGEELGGIRQVLEKDTVLHEMAETPLFLNIMILAYSGTDYSNIWVSKNVDEQRKHLFDTYTERIFSRPERSRNEKFSKLDVLRYLPWLAHKMVENNQVSFLIEQILPNWLDHGKEVTYMLINGLIFGLLSGLVIVPIFGPLVGLFFGLVVGLSFGLGSMLDIYLDDRFTFKLISKQSISGLFFGLLKGLFVGFFVGLIVVPIIKLSFGLVIVLISGVGGFFGLSEGQQKQVEVITRPGERLLLFTKNFLFVFLTFGLIGGLGGGLIVGLIFGLFLGLVVGGMALVQHYTMRFVLSKNHILPWRLIPFLDYCVDRIFLRRVGGGYIFVHRLLMEHFADMYSAVEK